MEAVAISILVTGTTGLVGHQLCLRLIEEGYSVVGLSRRKPSDFIKHGDFKLVKTDICNRYSVVKVFEKNQIETVFHLAARIPSARAKDSDEFFKTNVRGTLNILDAAVRSKVCRFIYSSTMMVYGKPIYLPVDEKHPTRPFDFYGVSKLAGELYVYAYQCNHDLSAVILRYSGVFGPRQESSHAVTSFIQKTLNNESLVISGDGTQTNDYVYVKDVTAANMLALKAVDRLRFDVFNIGGGVETSVNDLAEKISELCGVKVGIQHSDQHINQRFVYSIEKARTVVGYSPHTLDEGLREYIEWYKAYRLGVKRAI